MTWPVGAGADELREVLQTRGIAWYRFPGAEEIAMRPRALARELFGPSAVGRVDTEIVAPRYDRAEVVRSSGPAPLHADECPIMPAHVQVMLCHVQADEGGESCYLDTRPLLERLASEDPDLLELLFTAPVPLQPVFSWRSGCVVCTLGAVRPSGDGPRVRFAEVVDGTQPLVIAAEPGDVVIIDNHRWLHGRRAFCGPRRFSRYLCWLTRPLDAEPLLAERVRAAAEHLAATMNLEDAPSWTLPALVPHVDAASAGRLAAALACLAGEPERQVADDLGIELDDLRWLVERVMGAGLEALKDAGGQDESFAELSQASMRARARGALFAARAT